MVDMGRPPPPSRSRKTPKDQVGFECDPRIAHLYVIKSWGPGSIMGFVPEGRPPACSVLDGKLLMFFPGGRLDCTACFHQIWEGPG